MPNQRQAKGFHSRIRFDETPRAVWLGVCARRNGVTLDSLGPAKPVMRRWNPLFRRAGPCPCGPPQFGGQPVTNIRNVASPHWRGWLARNRCLVPATSFCGDRGAYASYGRPDNTLIDVKSRWAMPTIGQSLSRSSRRQPETASGRGASQIGRPERSRPSAPKCAP